MYKDTILNNEGKFWRFGYKNEKNLIIEMIFELKSCKGC